MRKRTKRPPGKKHHLGGGGGDNPKRPEQKQGNTPIRPPETQPVVGVPALPAPEPTLDSKAPHPKLSAGIGSAAIFGTLIVAACRAFLGIELDGETAVAIASAIGFLIGYRLPGLKWGTS